MINLIFDFDGCVIDSSEVQKAALFGSYNEIIGDDNFPSYEEYIKYTGDSVDNVLKKLDLPPEMAIPFRRISSGSIDKIKVNWNIIEYIRHMKQIGSKIAICTGKDHYRTIDILKYYNIADCFDVLICADDVVETKPSPAPIIKALEDLSSTKEDAVVIGDGYSDILSAKAAGVRSILTLWFGDNHVPHEADYIVDSVEHLKKCINQIRINILKKKVCDANLELVRRGVVIYTWGNVSGIDREQEFVVIKPSGVDYDGMKPEDMVVVDLMTGEKVEGDYKPSSDTATHLELYRAFPSIGGITHTHSINAVAFAQAGIDIPALGTTHADYFYGPIPCTRGMSQAEAEEAYELNTGRIIVECIKQRGIDPMAVPGVVVKNHGPFSWGKDPANSVYHAVVMDVVAEMDLKTLMLNPDAEMKQFILDKHYMRKHGPNAYYGQKGYSMLSIQRRRGEIL